MKRIGNCLRLYRGQLMSPFANGVQQVTDIARYTLNNLQVCHKRSRSGGYNSVPLTTPNFPLPVGVRVDR